MKWMRDGPFCSSGTLQEEKNGNVFLEHEIKL